jgi:hypothetical protein
MVVHHDLLWPINAAFQSYRAYDDLAKHLMYFMDNAVISRRFRQHIIYGENVELGSDFG